MTVIWRQWIEGFDSETEETGCTVTIDTAASGRDKNKLTSEIASATDTADRATGNVTTTAWLPSGDQGRIRLKYKPLAHPVGDPWNPLGNAIFLHLSVESPLKQIIELFNENDRQFAVFSQDETLRTTGSMPQGNAGSASVADTEYTIEVAWFGSTSANGFRRVWIDDVLLYELTSLDMGVVGDCVPNLFTLGFHHYDGADPEGLSCEIRWAQISDDPNETLTDPVDEEKQSFYITRSRSWR